MANKLDTEKPLFLGKTQPRADTVQGAIQLGVHTLDPEGDKGVSFKDLSEHMLKTFTPKKAAKVDESFYKSYVRDMVSKYGQLTHENEGNAYSPTQPTVKAEPAPKEEKPKKLTKADLAGVDTLAFIRDRGEVSDASEVKESQITVASIVQETKKKTKTIDGQVAKLAEKGFVTTEKRGEETYVFLTAEGLAFVDEHSARGDGVAKAADATAEAETTGNEHAGEDAEDHAEA